MNGPGFSQSSLVHRLGMEGIAVYETLLEVFPQSVSLVSLDGRLLSVNRAYLSLHGFDDPRELIGRSVFDFFAPQDMQAAVSSFQGLLEKREAPTLVARMLRRDGSEFICEIGSALICDRENTPWAVVCTKRDTTGQVRQQEALRQEELRFRLLFENSPVGMFIHDLEGTFIDGNPEAERISGYSKKELVGRNMLELNLLLEEQLPLLAELLGRSNQGQAAGPVELFLRRKDNTLALTEVVSIPFSLGGSQLVLGIAQDISERKKIERQSIHHERIEALSRLSSGLAHEINNPLAFIQSNMETLREYAEVLREMRKSAKEAASYLKKCADPAAQALASRLLGPMNRSAADVDALVGDVSSLTTDSTEGVKRITELLSSLLELGRFKAHSTPEQLSIFKIVNECLGAMPGRCGVSGCAIQFDGEDVPGVIVSKEDLLRALQHLLIFLCRVSGACSKDGNPIQILLTQSGNRPVLRILAPNMALSPGEINQIFDPHVQEDLGDGKTMRMNLMLALAYQMLSRNSALLSAEKLEPKGIAFKILF